MQCGGGSSIQAHLLTVLTCRQLFVQHFLLASHCGKNLQECDLAGSVAVRITDEGIKAQGVKVAHPRCGRTCVQAQVVVPLLEPVVVVEEVET